MRFLLFVILCPILLLASDNAMASGENYIVRRDYLNAAGTEYVDVVGYPYGMLMDGVSKSVQPYKFGGKELDRIGGINHYDFHVRQLQLPIPHFYQQDPYADKYPHLSPYLYCAANPLRYVDPSGKQPIKYTDDNGVKHINWSVVFMVESLNANASEKQILEHNEYKNRLASDALKEFNYFLNGGGEGAENSNGEKVISTFDIYVEDVADTRDKSVANRLATKYGQQIKEVKSGMHGSAAVFMDGDTNGSLGKNDRTIRITISPNAPYGTRSHELYHNTGIQDNGYNKGGILNSPPEPLKPEEVDLMWNIIPEKK